MNALERAFGFIHDRAQSYKLTFQTNQPANVAVLADLSKFCRANETCVVPNNRDLSLVLEGRREVWLRIQQHLHLTDEQLLALFSGNSAAFNGDNK